MRAQELKKSLPSETEKVPVQKQDLFSSVLEQDYRNLISSCALLQGMGTTETSSGTANLEMLMPN